TIPPVTIPSWPCLFSGLTPEQLGYYFFDHPNKGLFNSNAWKEKSIFSLIESKIFVLNVPGTYPAWKINGEMISGMMSPKISCYPPELNYFIGKNWIIDGQSISEIFEAFEIKKRLFLRKLKEDYALMVYVIRLPDALSHHTHLAPELINNYISIAYKKIDNFLGVLLKNDRVENIIIFSDHGLKYYKFEFNLQRWLEKKGLIFINKSKTRKFYSLIARIYDIFRPFIKIDYKKYHKLKNTLLKNIIDDSITIRDKIVGTTVLNFFGNVGGLFLNGRDKDKKEIIIDKLKTDKRVETIVTFDIEGFPDLFIILRDKYLFNHESSFFVTRGRNSINHSQYGFFLGYGKNIKNGKIDLINYIDIAPTILELLKIEKKNHMDGFPLNLFKEN
ncbi:MAG: alkaline phosphatase family protein, partial [Candidatus Thorarchaeota archaeon]